MSSTASRFVGSVCQRLLLVCLLSGRAHAQYRPHVPPQRTAHSLPVSDAARVLALLPRLPVRAVLRSPSVAVDRNVVYVAANLFYSDSVVGPSAYIGRLRRTAAGELLPMDRLGLPHGDFQFAYPRVAAGGGRLHLVWTELASRWRTNSQWATPANFSTSLWHAVREHGKWSTPVRISTSTRFGWDVQTGGVALEASGALHVVVWKGDDYRVPHVFDFRLSGGRWKGDSLPYLPGLMRATAAAVRGDTVIIAMVETLADTARVLVVASRDHGAAWPAPLVASQRSTLKAIVQRLALAPAAGGLLLAVGEQPHERSSLDTIRVFRLTGSLKTTSERIIAPPRSVAGFDLAAGPCGAGLLLLNSFSSEPHLFTAALIPDASTPVIRLLLPAVRTTFSGMVSDRGSAIAVFNVFPDSAPYRNVATILPICPR